MTIRKKWILTLGLIAVISILVNTLVLSILTSRYFMGYLDRKYDQTCTELVKYLSKTMSAGGDLSSKISVELDAYLGDSITQIKVYDDSGSLVAEAKDTTQAGNRHNMGMMHGMMGGMNQRYDIVDDFHITGDSGTLGEVHITRYTTSENTYAAIMFHDSLLRNSLVSVGIVLILVFLLGLIMSRKVSRDLIQTAEMAQNIEEGKENRLHFSKTKEIRMIQQSLKSLESRLKLKQKARKTLVDEMVHQTRTPLTILKMHLEGMEDGVIPMQAEEFQVCENQIDNLSDIILNISSLIDAGTDETAVVLEEFELHQFMRQIMNGMRAQFQKKNIDFRILTSEKIQVRTDKYRLGQSIYNILTNAYKFTPSGGNVSINYYKDGEMIKMEITDTGCGIPEEEQERIFDAYYKNSKDTGEAGDGIGLYVAKENIGNVHGKIEVQSIMGQGSKFTVIILSDMDQS
jgi:signal transduction histidine kinase